MISTSVGGNHPVSNSESGSSASDTPVSNHFFSGTPTPHGNYDPAVTILSRISLASRHVRSLASVTERDWYTWHHDYDEPGTALARRLAAVQDQIRTALDAAPPGPLHAVSLCAGQGRDLIGALAGHPRRDDVSARLVELDPRNAAAARAAADGRGAAAGRGGDRRRGADRSLRRDGAGLPGAGLRGVRQHDRRRRTAHDRLLHPAVRARRHGGVDPRPVGAGPGAADLRLVRRPRLRAGSGCPTRRRAGERARTASPRPRSRWSAGPACSPSSAITRVPVPIATASLTDLHPERTGGPPRRQPNRPAEPERPACPADR